MLSNTKGLLRRFLSHKRKIVVEVEMAKVDLPNSEEEDSSSRQGLVLKPSQDEVTTLVDGLVAQIDTSVTECPELRTILVQLLELGEVKDA